MQTDSPSASFELKLLESCSIVVPLFGMPQGIAGVPDCLGYHFTFTSPLLLPTCFQVASHDSKSKGPSQQVAVTTGPAGCLFMIRDSEAHQPTYILFSIDALVHYAAPDPDFGILFPKFADAS